MARFSEVTGSPSGSIDREAKVIRGVKILGAESRNKRRYPESVIQSAVPLYEGAKVNFDHPSRKGNPGERKFSDGGGVIKGCRFESGDGGKGIYGDLHYLESHPNTALFLERAERFPDSFGLSHIVEGELAWEGGAAVVKSIERVVGVDIVTDPATTSGLFESFEGEGMAKIRLIELFAGDDTVAKTLRENLEAAGIDPAMEVDVPAEDAPSGDDAVKMGFRAAIIAVIDDDTLDMAGKLAKVKELLKSEEKVMDSGPDPAAEPGMEEGGGEEAAAETAAAAESVDRKLAVVNAKELLLESNRKALPERIEALVAVSETTRKTLVEGWPADLAGGVDQAARPAVSKSARATQDVKAYASKWDAAVARSRNS